MHTRYSLLSDKGRSGGVLSKQKEPDVYHLNVQLTEQMIFDYVADALLTQNRKSLKQYRTTTGISSENACAYRGRDNTRCGIGHLIRDEEYKLTMEGKTVNSLVDLFNITFRHLKPFAMPDKCLLDTLQRVHDRHEPHAWYQEFKRIARNYALSFAYISSRYHGRFA